MQVRYVTVILSIAVATCASPAAPQRTGERETTSATPQSAWKLFYSSGTTLSEAAGGLPVITMPTSGTANMLTKAWSGSAAGSTLHLTIQVDTTGTPLFHLAQGPEPTCRTPPSARPYLEAVGWEAMPPPYPSMRWWSRQAFVALAQAGTFSIDVPLTPDRWSGVSGQLAAQDATSQSWFAQIVTASVPARAGLVFGGGCSYGHGLYVSGGSATLTVSEFDAR